MLCKAISVSAKTERSLQRQIHHENKEENVTALSRVITQRLAVIFTDVSEQTFGPILRVQESTIRCVITQKSAVLSYFAAEV
jgi:hypothetical protein